MAANYVNSMSTMSVDWEPVEIIAQPSLTSKLRYRADYSRDPIRRGPLVSINNPNYNWPTIRIPQAYLNGLTQYYIRVALVTVINEETKYRYNHPYDFEDIDGEEDIDGGEHVDAPHNVIIYRIKENDFDGIKSFPALRIVKKKADELRDYTFTVFDSPNSPAIPALPTPKKTIKDYNLDRFQLAFTVGRTELVNGIPQNVFYACTTQFSEEMIDIHSRVLESSTTSVEPKIPKSTICEVNKYAPRSGSTAGNDEVLIFLTNKLRTRHGSLEITFEYDLPGNYWSESAVDIETKDQMISFRTPPFPHSFDSPTKVNIILKHRKQTFDPLEFLYIPTVVRCTQCQRNIIRNPNPNKRTVSDVYDEQTGEPTNRSQNNPDVGASGYSETFDDGWFSS